MPAAIKSAAQRMSKTCTGRRILSGAVRAEAPQGRNRFEFISIYLIYKHYAGKTIAAAKGSLSPSIVSIIDTIKNS